MICVSLTEQTVSALLHRMTETASRADVIEVRLDTLQHLDAQTIEVIMKSRPRPLIFTNRAMTEGGAFRGREDERVEHLEEAAAAGADYVDLELMTEKALRDRLLGRARKAGTRVIFSYHDFRCTPPKGRLRRILDWQRGAGADIGKIVTMASDIRDVSRVLSLMGLSQDLNFPLIAFCMGEAGRASRVACLAMGAYLTYSSPSEGRETAPGQIPLEDLRSIVDFLRLPQQADNPF